MLKDLLIQFIISLLPIFAFQVWSSMDRGWRNIPVFLGLLSGAAMVLCMVVTTDYSSFEVDFGLTPYLIGSLYGGVYALAALTFLYALIRLPMMDSTWEIVTFAIFIFSYIPVVFMMTRRFQRASHRKKQKLGLIIASVYLLYHTLAMIGYIIANSLTWTMDMVFTYLLTAGGSLAAVWISIFVVESLKENKQLHYEVRRISVNHRREVEKLQQFIDEMSIAVILVNHHGRITNVNEMGYRLFLNHSNIRERSEVVGKYYTAFLNPIRQDGDIRLLYEALKGNRMQLEPKMEDGRMLLKTAFCIRNLPNGAITGAAIIAQDVTELTMLRNEVGRMERLSLVGQMAASITHEIRNPMAVIRGFVQLMRERSPESQQEYYRIVMEELDRANTIISDFLSLAQNRVLSMSKASLNDIIKELLPLLEADAHMRNQTIELDLGEIPPIMLNDKEIKQLLLNIARNGMEAMGDKGTLWLRTVFDETKKGIALYIKDEGVGIPEEQMDRLFEPFFTTKSRGTGLGLPLCLSIAERHNGRIDVESEEGKGTTFIVSFAVE
ncbi:ATP-binding protein [Paenibacillus sp. NPDC058071]|uniref:ATP-binding protein n=1 Tax=Paenibacillus sp. NPDC058071 TaxID=3346326 RepID=UPI0036DA0915